MWCVEAMLQRNELILIENRFSRIFMGGGEDTKKRFVCLCDVILPYSTRGLAKLSSFLRNDSSFMEKIRTNDFLKVGTHPVQGLGRGVVLGERSFPEK